MQNFVWQKGMWSSFSYSVWKRSWGENRALLCIQLIVCFWDFTRKIPNSGITVDPGSLKVFKKLKEGSFCSSSKSSPAKWSLKQKNPGIPQTRLVATPLSGFTGWDLDANLKKYTIRKIYEWPMKQFDPFDGRDGLWVCYLFETDSDLFFITATYNLSKLYIYIYIPKPPVALADYFVRPAILCGLKTLTFTASLEASQSSPGNFPNKKKKTGKLIQSGYDGCPRSSQKLSGSFPEVLWAKTRNAIRKSALCGTRRKSMCHGWAGIFLRRLLNSPGSFPEAFQKFSGSRTFLEGPWPTQRPGPCDFAGVQHAWTARAAEPRIARGAHLVRLDAKLNHALGEHTNKHHVLWFRPDGDDSVRGARLSVFGWAKTFSN